MATTTASKAGLRATATAKRTKAAQRTPLPPNPADVALAREAVVEVQAARAPRQRAAKAAPAPNGHKPGSIAETAKPFGRPARKATTPKAEAPQRHLKTAPNKPTKAARYAGEFKQLGWIPEITTTDALVELVAKRDSEAIYLAWRNEAHVSGTSTYTINDRTVKVRNPAEAMRIAGQTPAQASAKQMQVASNRQFRRRPTGPTIKNVPFNVETATDDEVISALEARRISWHNAYRVESETATVGRAKGVSISLHPDGYRVVSFVDPENGYRAFRLDRLENVGRKVDLVRIRQDILKALSKDDDKPKRKSARQAA